MKVFIVALKAEWDTIAGKIESLVFRIHANLQPTANIRRNHSGPESG